MRKNGLLKMIGAAFALVCVLQIFGGTGLPDFKEKGKEITQDVSKKVEKGAKVTEIILEDANEKSESILDNLFNKAKDFDEDCKEKGILDPKN